MMLLRVFVASARAYAARLRNIFFARIAVFDDAQPYHSRAATFRVR